MYQIQNTTFSKKKKKKKKIKILIDLRIFVPNFSTKSNIFLYQSGMNSNILMKMQNSFSKSHFRPLLISAIIPPKNMPF